MSQGAVGAPSVTAIVPAKDSAERIAATVRSLVGLARVDRVVVVDDGSGDATAEEAASAGATVVRLPVNRGKGAALAAGVEAAPDADVYLLVDADVAGTAGLAAALLGPIEEGTADLVIGVLPSAGRKGGFGTVRSLAAAGIRRATGWHARAPLSGQRAVRGDLLRSLRFADRFGVEVAMTIDALRAGARLVEVDVAMDHRHTGRRLAGFRHRGRQGIDIARALWPRLTSVALRMTLVVGALVLATGGSLWSSARSEPSSVALTPGADVAKVVIFGFPRLTFDDLEDDRFPELQALADDGAVAAMSVRTRSGRPSTGEAYVALGSGTRSAAAAEAGYAFDADDALESGTAAQALARRSGVFPKGDVVVVGAPAVRSENRDLFLTSEPGALGTALNREDRRAAVIGNADTGYRLGTRPSLYRPAAAAAMDLDGDIDVGRVGTELLLEDLAAPFGRRADPAAMLAEFDAAFGDADLVVVDPGDVDRAAEFGALADPGIAEQVTARAKVDTSRLLGEIRRRLPPDALLLVVSPVPPTREWNLTPVLATGAGVRHGHLHSTATRRVGVVTITDVAPTVLAELGVDPPAGMIGRPLEARPGVVDLDRLREIDRDAAFREGIYLPITLTYIVLQALVYLAAVLLFGRLGGAGRLSSIGRLLVLAISAYPLATFVFRAIPDVAALGAGAVVVLVAVDVGIAVLALRARRHPLSPLAWILGATILVLAVDVATGATLQTSSLLGYSLHTAARFTGFGNTAFATLAASTVLLAAIHVQYAPRRREALLSAAALFAFVIVVDGSPALGSDVGGILTLVPVFGLTLLVLSGRKVSVRAVALAAAVTVTALAVATGVDLLRPAGSRTHLGRLVGDVQANGFEVFSTTVRRKLAVNFRTYRSPWSWTVVIATAYMLFVLGWTRGWRDLLPARSALRAGVVGALAAGLLGYAVNDSGVVVTALVFVYIGPFLTMLAIAREQGERVVVEAQA